MARLTSTICGDRPLATSRSKSVTLPASRSPACLQLSPMPIPINSLWWSDTCRRQPRAKRHAVGSKARFCFITRGERKLDRGAVTFCTTSSCLLSGHGRVQTSAWCSCRKSTFEIHRGETCKRPISLRFIALRLSDEADQQCDAMLAKGSCSL